MTTYPQLRNFVLSYDLNGPFPSHKQMDDHLRKLVANRGRILETVWWVQYPGTAAQLRDRVKTILGNEGLLLVIEGKSAAWTKLLVSDSALKTEWEKAA